MSVTVIVLGVLLVIALYILYRYFVTRSTSLATQANLNNTSIPTITVTDSPKTMRYAVGYWMYINSWSNTGANKPIVSRANQFSVYLDKTTPTLYVDISQNCTGGTVVTPPIAITTDFPMQKWTHVVVNADSKFVDLYLDGKMIKSIKLACDQATPPDGGSSGVPIVLGGVAGTDVMVSTLKRWSAPMSPQDVWSDYLSGAGNSWKNMFSAYGVGVSLYRDNVEQSMFRLF
jgi:23S rRNA pseudoU1915 N3-methylase RlmH